MKQDRFVPLGRITKPQGLRGAFRVRAHSVESENLTSLKQIFLETATGESIEADVRSVQARTGFFIVEVAQIDHIDQVTPLVGQQVLARREDLVPLDDDEFYWFELIGLSVETVDGQPLGTIESIIPTGANDVLSLKHNGREILIPYIDEVVKQVDLARGVVIIDPIPGLLD